MNEQEATEAIKALWHDLIRCGYELPDAFRVSDRERARRAAAEATEAWVAVLEPIPPHIIRQVGMAWVRQDRYGKWPKPGQVLRCAQDLVEQQASMRMTADEAWGHVLGVLVPRFDTHRTVPHSPDTFDEAWDVWSRDADGGFVPSGQPFVVHHDPVVAAGMLAGIAAVGGWRALGMMSAESAAPNRAAFRSAFNAAVSRQQTRLGEGAVAFGAPAPTLHLVGPLAKKMGAG